MIQKDLDTLIVSFPFETLEMIQQANEESVVLLDIFQLIKKYEQQSSCNHSRSELDIRLIVIIEDRLYIKKYGKDTIEVFPNTLFLNLNKENQYLAFVEDTSRKEDSHSLKKEVVRLLQRTLRKFCALSIRSMELKTKKIILHDIIQAELSVYSQS